MRYEDFDLQIGPRQGDGWLVRVPRSPAGQGEGFLRLPLTFATGPAAALPDLLDAGASLFTALFSGGVGTLFHQSLSRVSSQPGQGLRIRLHVNPEDRSLAPLQAVPWEILRRPETDDFLALHRGTPVVRTLAVARPAALAPWQPPLRVLIVVPGASGARDLDLEQELGELEAVLDRHPHIEAEILRDPDLGQLRDKLDRWRAHVLHYMGHGYFEPATGEGSLPLRRSGGGHALVSGRALATKVKDLGSLRLVVLNACDTARTSGDAAHAPFAGLAPALVLGGIPAVVAMQSPVPNRRAIAFSTAFYSHLAGGRSVEEAMTEGRQAIHGVDSDDGCWAAPVLFLRAASGELFALQDPHPRRASSPKLAALLLIGVLGAGLASWQLWASRRSGEGAGEGQVEAAEALAPDLEPPAVLPASQPVQLRSGAGTFDLEVTFPPSTASGWRTLFLDALGSTAQTLGEARPSLAGSRLEVELEPLQVEAAGSKAGWWTCSVRARHRWIGPRDAGRPRPAYAVRTQATRDAACEAALRFLATVIGQQLDSPLEDTPP